MSTKTSFVGYNGNGYNSATGQIINAFKPAGSQNGQVIDGFVKSSSRRRATRSTELHKRTEKAQTLVRSGLKKPAKQLGSQLQKLNPATGVEREARAKTIPKHNRVNRFGGAARSAFSAAQAAPRNLSGEIGNLRRRSASSEAKAVPAPVPSMVTSVSHQKLERLLDEALINADAHKAAMEFQAARHFWRRRWLSGHRRWLVVAVFFAALVASVFIAWQRIPQLSLKAASIRAHLDAVTPTYKPVGYRMAGPAKIESDAVSLTYQSQIGGGSYVISQAPSNLTSDLLAHSVVPKNAPVQTSQVDGNTVYIYGSSNNAAWVNNGVLYTIKDSANLSSDELINIVKGINP